MSSPDVDDLITFWRKQLDHLERVARDAGGDTPEGNWHQVDAERSPGRIEDANGSVVTYDEGSPDEGQAPHIAANDPASVLADITADRAIIAALAEARKFNDQMFATLAAGSGPIAEQLAIEVSGAYLAGLEHAARIRVAKFASHPDYRQEWQP